MRKMRKVLLLSTAVAVLFIGSLSLGVAAALTGAPVFYDARAPQPTPTASDGFDAEAGASTTSPGTSDGADDGDAAPPPPPSPVPTPVDPTPDAPEPEAPTPSTPPADPLPTVDEQSAWLAFQQAVRECMVDAGQEYRYWEWWTTEPRNPNSTAPAMPDSLSAEGRLAWHAALEGADGDGTGCLGQAAEEDREESVPSPPSPSPEPSASPEPPPSPDAGPQPPVDGVEPDGADPATAELG